MPGFVVGWYHFMLAFLSAFYYGFPSRKLKVIGITGTNGKTTTINLLERVLAEVGHKVATASSIKFKIGSQEEENKLKMTMPGRFVLQGFLRRAVRAGCKYAIVEVTSEGVLQHRHRLIDFDTAVFTNLSPEHIEHHGSFENYRKAKGKFFKKVKGRHIINLDDENSDYFLQFKAKKKIGYSVFDKLSRVAPTVVGATDVICTEKSISFTVQGIRFDLNLIGRFNVYNALAAICVGLAEGISLKQCEKGLEKAEGVPGRMETIIFQPFKVIVDYAFTPNALRKVYQTLRKFGHSSGQKTNLVCVLGACGGGRDKWKRKVLGEIAAENCRDIIVTDEDPYDEDPMEIINQVAGGAGDRALKILDRRQAIKKSLQLAKPGGTVIITGKGCEPWICVANNKKIPWDDRKIVREEYEKLKTD